MADHGINVSRADTAVATPNTATCGIPFVIGTAPLSKATGTPATAGLPVLCTSYDEAKEQLGYDDDWAKYTVCEVMHYHFKLCACQPVIFLPVGETAEAADVAAAVEQIELCLTMFGIVPDLIMAPGFSQDATVAAVMDAKAGSINGMFTGKALVDISAKTYTAAVQAKNSGTYTEKTILCWPNGTLGDLRFHGSTVETVVLLSHKKPDSYIHIDVEFGEGEGKIPVDKIVQRAEQYKPKERVTYKRIKEYILEKYGFKVHTAYIAEVKRSLGLPMYDAPNAVEKLKQARKHPTPEKVEAIKDALHYFAVI